MPFYDYGIYDYSIMGPKTLAQLVRLLYYWKNHPYAHYFRVIFEFDSQLPNFEPQRHDIQDGGQHGLGFRVFKGLGFRVFKGLGLELEKTKVKTALP